MLFRKLVLCPQFGRAFGLLHRWGNEEKIDAPHGQANKAEKTPAVAFSDRRSDARRFDGPHSSDPPRCLRPQDNEPVFNGPHEISPGGSPQDGPDHRHPNRMGGFREDSEAFQGGRPDYGRRLVLLAQGDRLRRDYGIPQA